MKRIEKSWMALPCLFDWALLATSVTIAPASSTWRCGWQVSPIESGLQVVDERLRSGRTKRLCR